ncbi:MAG: alanine racemase, partial [Proteobacteria bacterium]|nr:alanine racemase [Pseudomonadota bacterium]
MIPEALEAEIRGRVESVRARIEAAAARAGRSPEEVTLVGISKRQAPERVAAAVLAGVAHLGENYVQEARGKRAAVEDLLRGRGAPAPCWHMVGGLQRNKARDSVQIFRVIETVDRAPLAVELDRRAGAASAVIHVLLQVNLSGEDQKGGTEP